MKIYVTRGEINNEIARSYFYRYVMNIYEEIERNGYNESGIIGRDFVENDCSIIKKKDIFTYEYIWESILDLSGYDKCRIK